MPDLFVFKACQIKTITAAVSMAEELVSNHFKMSASEWLRPKYDVKTLSDLSPEEIVDGPFAQIVRYEGRRSETPLGSTMFDFYKICLQDHAISLVLQHSPEMKLFPFALYVITHELVHIVRFSKFLQSFDASAKEKMIEEKRVHEKTYHILVDVGIDGLQEVLQFFKKWRQPLEDLRKQ